MRTSFVVTFVGDDAPGLVEQIAAAVSNAGGNWLESRSTQLGGRFAGIVRIDVASASAVPLQGALRALTIPRLHISIEAGDNGVAASDVQRLTLHILGLDRPGIVHEVTRTLASLGINVVDLRTSVFAAAMSGELMFEANALVECSHNLPAAQIEDALEGASQTLGIDVELSAQAPA